MKKENVNNVQLQGNAGGCYKGGQNVNIRKNIYWLIYEAADFCFESHH